VAPRNIKIIKLYKEKTPLFDKYNLEEQIRAIYQERVDLKSGGYIVINPTEAMVTIDVNSGRGSHKRNVEETAFITNTDAAEEIARQLRLRDIGGLIVIDFIDMAERKHQIDVEKAFKNSLSLDRSRIQLSKISKFGILELSRQKKQSTIQEISYTTCPFCEGSGVRPSLEYIALSAFRKLESQAVKDIAAELNVSLPHEVANYLLNQKRKELLSLENDYNLAIHISSNPNISWSDMSISIVRRDQGTGSNISEIKLSEKTTKGNGRSRSRSSRKKPKESLPPENTDLPTPPIADSDEERTAATANVSTDIPEKRESRLAEDGEGLEIIVSKDGEGETKVETASDEGKAKPVRKRSRRPYQRRKKKPAEQTNGGEVPQTGEQDG
ncbi:MAG: ribonuclease E/G, partial [Syntrophobacterales bacterium]|nr:ribonuclease E/G [Syntrophobacterales bacterium]